MYICRLGDRSKTMVATKENQKSTAMDYLSAPRSEGLVVALLSLLGFTAPENGRLPAGVKYDFIKVGIKFENEDKFKKKLKEFIK